MKEFISNTEEVSFKIVFDDEGITVRKEKNCIDNDDVEILHCFCPYERIINIECIFNTLILDFCYNDKKFSNATTFSNLKFFQKQSLKSAIKFALEKKKNASKPFKEVQVFEEKKGKFSDEDEHIMLCERCGHIYYFTDDDLEYCNYKLQNAKSQNNSFLVDSLLYGNAAAAIIQAENDNIIRANIEQLDEFFECPKCKSEHVKRITEQELKEILEKNNSSQKNVSAADEADELKKFKDLLDSGVITQEEFDAKKKQLLGL